MSEEKITDKKIIAQTLQDMHDTVFYNTEKRDDKKASEVMERVSALNRESDRGFLLDALLYNAENMDELKAQAILLTRVVKDNKMSIEDLKELFDNLEKGTVDNRGLHDLLLLILGLKLLNTVSILKEGEKSNV